MLSTGNSSSAQSSPRLYRSVSLSATLMNFTDLYKQSPLLPAPLGLRTISPSVIATATDLKHFTHPRDPKFSNVSPDERVLYLSSLAKYAAAFFRMSRSSLTRSNSCFNRASSLPDPTRCPDPGNAPTPFFLTSSCHLYSRLRGIPNSRANSDAGRLPASKSRTASSLNSWLNRLCLPIAGIRSHRMMSKCSAA
jgi:hypothetical protein